MHLHRAGSGPPVVFLHGWTMAGDIFADAMAQLGGQFSCYAPDLPGHGATTGYAVTVAGAAQLLDDLLRRENLTDVTLVGWSLGALVAWHHIGTNEGQGIARMISLDMSPRPLNGPDWALGLCGQDAAAARAKSGWFRSDWATAAGAIATSMFAGPEGAPGLSVEQARARIEANDPETMVAMWASLIETDCRDAVRGLPVPLLAIHGARSQVYPQATGDWLAEAAPQGACRSFARSGHAPNLEQPQDFARAVAEFASG